MQIWYLTFFQINGILYLAPCLLPSSKIANFNLLLITVLSLVCLDSDKLNVALSWSQKDELISVIKYHSPLVTSQTA